MKTGKLGLQIPIHEADKYTQIKMTPDSIKKWRASLPMADTGATAKKLFVALNELNQVELESEKRFEILELLRPPLQLVCQSLKKHYLNTTTPITKQKLTIANLAQTLQLEVVNGYKTILEELDTNKTESTKNMIPLMIKRIMYYYNIILFRCYQLYSQEPKGLWKELYLLYQYAKKENLLEYKFEDSSFLIQQTQTILDDYKHILLLSISNPFQWKQNEQEIIKSVLDKWISYISLQNYSEQDQQKPGVYIFDLTKDQCPAPLGLKLIEPSNNCITINLDNTCAHLQTILSELNENETKARMAHDKDPEYSISIPTLERLFKSWNTIVTRKYVRFPIKGNMQVIFGLSTTHQYICGDKSFTPDNNEQKKQSSLEISGIELSESKSNNDDASSSKIEFASKISDNKLNIKLNNEEKTLIYNCSIVDISSTGYCLIWESDIYPLVQPGEIIAMRLGDDKDASNTAPWSIGVIRWVKHTPTDQIRIGVQLLAPYAKPIGVQIFKDENPIGYFLRCLSLPQLDGLSLNPTIITPILPFKQGKFINLYDTDEGAVSKMKLTKQVDSSSSYRQFEFTNVEVKKAELDKDQEPKDQDPFQDKNKERKHEKDITDKFKSIWDEI